MPFILVSEAVSTAIFTITRILFDSALGTFAVILFSKLPGGSSAKFWYDQPDLVSKVASLFHPFGPTGKRGHRFTNAIAVICMILALALNILPTILSKLSPITVISMPIETNSTLSPISNIFIPTLTDINVPGLSYLDSSRASTVKFLCSYLNNGCQDSKNNTIASIVWDNVTMNPTTFFYQSNASNPNGNLLVSINDTFATATTPQQHIFIAKNSFSMATNATTVYNNWENNNLTAFYNQVNISPNSPRNSDVFVSKYDYLHADQFDPLTTPDLSDLLRQGRRVGEAVPANGSVDHAERWTAIHRTTTLSSLLWQSVNSHSGTVENYLEPGTCFFCQLIGVQEGSDEMAAVTAAMASSENNLSYALHSYIDSGLRLTTTLCLLERTSPTTTSLSYWCIHTYSQLYNVQHNQNPYEFFGNFENSANGLEQVDQTTGTAFPFFPPPQHLATNRTYIPIVPIFELRSKGQCSADWDFRTGVSVQTWMKDCAATTFKQVGISDLETIANNTWQIGSTITVGGFLVTATYNSNQVGIQIGLVPQIVVLCAIVLCFFINILVNFITSPIHRKSLYEVIRTMIPDSRDPYNVQKVLNDMEPTNTLRLVDSVYDTRVSYLKLNNRLVVTLSERHESKIDDDLSTLNNDAFENTDYTSRNELQSWSKRQLVRF